MKKINALLLVLIGCFITVIFLNSKDFLIRFAAVLFSIIFLALYIISIMLIRKKIVEFARILGISIDNMINNKKEPPFDLESETLASKFNHKLKRLYEIMDEKNDQIQKEKQTIQEVISDISHQVKIPIANLKMYNSTLLLRQLPQKKEHEFLSLMETQIDKLNFLMQSMIKMSRLEVGTITLNIQPNLIYDTIALALGSIVLPAEKKSINVTVSCDSSIKIPHDKKWTTEALFNILDNAVKYTKMGGKITISVEKWEIYTKIDISDTGKGISEKHFSQIFKRFYREEDVHDIEGVGIGLYLSRKIISMQNGYIQVKSKINNGSTFSVFIPNERQQ